MDGKRITRLLGVGIRDIKTLDVGHMGTANGWYMYHGWYNSELPKFLMQLCEEQGVKFTWKRGKWDCDNTYYNNEYNISYDVDSSG